MNLRQRLEALVENPRLQASGRDYEFIKSLLAYYNKNKRLTSGRRVWVDRLEERYSADAPDNSDQEMADRISRLLSRVAVDTWDYKFLGSIAERNRQHGQLSPKQVHILGKIEGRYSEEALASRDAWVGNWNAEKAERIKAAAEYYLANPPYYGDLARQVLDNAAFVPTERQYRAMTENKFAAKVIREHFSEPAFPVGSKVSARSCATGRFRNKKGFVMKVGAKPITAAAKGSKVYMVLPIGDSVPVYVEERHLKKGRF